MADIDDAEAVLLAYIGAMHGQQPGRDVRLLLARAGEDLPLMLVSVVGKMLMDIGQTDAAVKWLQTDLLDTALAFSEAAVT